MWKAAAADRALDYGRDLAKKTVLEKSSRHRKSFAEKIGAETAEKWAVRLDSTRQSAIGARLHFRL